VPIFNILLFFCLALVGWIDLGSCPNNSVSQKEECNQDTMMTLLQLAKYGDRWLDRQMHLSTVHPLFNVVAVGGGVVLVVVGGVVVADISR
jgi:hypothetical protein